MELAPAFVRLYKQRWYVIGVRRTADGPESIQQVRCRPFDRLIEEIPLHESQQRVCESADGMYREYTLTVRASRNFLQELLWHGRNIMVLKPESLRQQMVGIPKDMTASYETGECRNGEEQ